MYALCVFAQFNFLSLKKGVSFVELKLFRASPNCETSDYFFIIIISYFRETKQSKELPNPPRI